jgi:type I restriction enzyme S subunit
MGVINIAVLSDILTVVPPETEQNKVVQFIELKNSRFDGLVDRAVTATNLLKERRTALISAAVTGKIDVRNWQPPASPDINKEAAA